MIPTMLVLGLVLGRWWRTALAVSAVVWPVMLVVTGVVSTVGEVVAASGLSLVNAGLGVAVHQGLRRLAGGRARAACPQP